jgi:hypothetical protein
LSIHRLTVADGRYAGAITQMSNYQTARQIGAQLLHNRFAGKAMKSIAPNARGTKRFGQRKDSRDIRQIRVEYRVETRHLRQPGKSYLYDADQGQGCWNVQGRERYGVLQLVHHGLVNAAMAAKPGTALDHPMPDSVG